MKNEKIFLLTYVKWRNANYKRNFYWVSFVIHTGEERFRLRLSRERIGNYDIELFFVRYFNFNKDYNEY